MFVVHLLFSFSSVTLSHQHLSGTDIPLDKIHFIIVFFISFAGRTVPFIFIYILQTDTKIRPSKRCVMSILGIIVKKEVQWIGQKLHLPSLG
jgi:hypothetical protein